MSDLQGSLLSSVCVWGGGHPLRILLTSGLLVTGVMTLVGWLPQRFLGSTILSFKTIAILRYYILYDQWQPALPRLT